MNRQCGSLVYASPQSYHGDDYYGRAADGWSYGVVLYVMLCVESFLSEARMQGISFFHTPVRLSLDAYSIRASSLPYLSPLRRCQEFKLHWGFDLPSGARPGSGAMHWGHASDRPDHTSRHAERPVGQDVLHVGTPYEGAAAPRCNGWRCVRYALLCVHACMNVY